MSTVVSGKDAKVTELLEIFGLGDELVKTLTLQIEGYNLVTVSAELYVTPDELGRVIKVFKFTEEMENTK